MATNLYKIIKDLQKEKGLTSVSCAEKAGITKQSWSVRRKPGYNPAVTDLNKMLEIFGYELRVRPKKYGPSRKEEFVIRQE